MKLPPRQHLRPLKSDGAQVKKFRRLIEPQKRVTKVDHPLMVVNDLRRGSLASLNRYLATHRGIPDHMVAVELRKLISGSAERTQYRLVVVQHPGAPKHTGGRPRSNATEPSTRDWEIVARYEALLVVEGKAYRAKEQAAEEFNLSPETVLRAIRRVDRARSKAITLAEKEEKRAEIIRMRNEALAKLRGSKLT